ncbi:MAG TPA: succinate dehydrogenase assembly factor 2 [Xanthobacteraceae bacterium]|jgi:antitoxin CptB
MADPAVSDPPFDVRRRRLLFRAWHRGMREVDLIMGRFADHEVAEWGIEELEEFERLLEVADHELLAWIVGGGDVPQSLDTALFRRLRDFNRQGCGAR